MNLNEFSRSAMMASLEGSGAYNFGDGHGRAKEIGNRDEIASSKSK